MNWANAEAALLFVRTNGSRESRMSRRSCVVLKSLHEARH